MKRWKIVTTTVLGLFLVLLYTLRNPTSLTYSKIRLQSHCLYAANISQITIEEWMMNLQVFYNTDKEECVIIRKVIDQLYEFEVGSRPLNLTSRFREKIKEWFGTLDRADEFQTQVVTTVYNKWTRISSSRNSFRNRKPRNENASSTSTLFETIDASARNCDFCQMRVASDFISLSNDYATVAGNAFKLQDYNALFIFKQHNPLKLTFQDYDGLFKLANEWFSSVEESSSEGHDHPIIAWDSLPSSGGSQIHAHMHGFLGRKHKLGRFRAIEDARQLYFLIHPESDLTQDFINVHVALGLAVRVGQNSIISPLDAVCNHELIVVGPQIDQSFVELVYAVHRTMINELKIFSWSAAITWPNDGDLAKFVIGARSDNYAVTSMELYLFSSLTSNPYETISAVKRTLRRMSR